MAPAPTDDGDDEEVAPSSSSSSASSSYETDGETSSRDEDAGSRGSSEGGDSDSAASSSSSSSSSSSASGDSSDSDSDSDSDAPEPILKYQRLGASLPDLLADDAATCACAWEGGVLALGTASGRVRVFDSLGGELKRFASHRAGPVRAVSFDARGEFVASCSEDGTVAIRGLYVDEHQVTRAFGRAMRAVALDPDFARAKSRRFVCGGVSGALIINGVGWMGHRADATLHSGEGTVHAVSWAGALIAWANDAGVKLYDADRSESVAFVDRPRGSPAPELHAPRLAWDDGGRTLIIGWADCVKIATVGTEGGRAGEGGGHAGEEAAAAARRGGESASARWGRARATTSGSAGGPRAGLIPSRDDAGGGASGGSSRPRSSRSRRVVEVTAMFQTEYVVAGVAPLGANLVVLAEALDAPISGRGARPRPEVRVVTRKNEDLSRDALAVRGCDSLGPGDAFLAPVVAKSRKHRATKEYWGDDALGSGSAASFHVVAPRDVVRVTPRTAEDRVRWFVQRGAFEKALAACEDAEAAAAEAASRGVVGPTSSPFALSAPLPPSRAESDPNAADPDDSGGMIPPPPLAPIREGGSATARDEVASAYLERLLRDPRGFEEAAALCPRLLRRSKLLWERWIFRFARARGALRALAPYVPTADPTLSRETYETILHAFLADERDHARFLAVVRAWPSKLFSVRGLIAAVGKALDAEASFNRRAGPAPARLAKPRLDHLDHLEPDGTDASSSSSSTAVILKEALAELYLADGQRDRALELHLELGRPSAVDFASRHELFRRAAESERGALASLCAADATRAAAALAERRDENGLGFEVVEARLRERAEATGARGDREAWHAYLRALFDADPTGAHRALDDRRVPLTIEFDPEGLGAFLNAEGARYDVEKALEAIDGHDRRFLRERVFLLGRLGSWRAALEALVLDLGDVPGAVAFVQSRVESESASSSEAAEMWDAVVALVVEGKGSASADVGVGSLFDAAGALVDPSRVLRRVPPGARADGLRTRLAGILRERRREARESENVSRRETAAIAEAEKRRRRAARRALRPDAVEVED